MTFHRETRLRATELSKSGQELAQKIGKTFQAAKEARLSQMSTLCGLLVPMLP